MRETYLRPSQISTIMSHIENPDIERTVYLDIFRHIQGHTKLFSHVQPYSGTFKVIQPCQAILRDSKVYLGIFTRYSHMLNNLGEGGGGSTSIFFLFLPTLCTYYGLPQLIAFLTQFRLPPTYCTPL